MTIRTPSLLLAASLALLLGGCGGGGGGGALVSGFVAATTDWTNHSNPNGGLSENLSLFDSNGLLVQSLVVNSTDPPSINFNSLPAGLYHLSGALFSQANLGGVQTGSFDTFVTLSGSTPVRIDVGNTPTKLAVLPITASIAAQQSQQFYATLNDPASHIVYTPIGQTIGWSTLGGVATIGTTGIAIGSNAGTGSVQASYAPSNLFGAAVLNVAPFTPTMSKWTVLVYMNAANDLDSDSVPNILQMQKVAGVPANVRFVVQWKQAVIVNESPTPSFFSTRRYLIEPSTGNQVVSKVIQDMGTGVDMGDPQTMADFLNWGKANFPAERYCVVVWNHGNGWAAGRAAAAQPPTRGFSYDDDTGNHIDTWQLSQSLGTLQPDILAWDASLMQMVEVAYEARNQVKFVVGSEASPPAAGYPYDLVFASFRDNPDDTSANLSNSFVTGMLSAYSTAQENITQSVLDTSQLPALVSSISGLADALIANQSAIASLVPAVRDNAEGHAISGTENVGYDDSAQLGRLYRDLFDVCRILQTGTGSVPGAPAGVDTAAQSVQTAIQNAVIHEGHNSFDSNARGVSISFYGSTSIVPFSNVSSTYQLLGFAQDSHWPNWLTVSP